MTWGQFFNAMKTGTGQILRGGRRGGQQAANKGTTRQASTKAPVVTSQPKQPQKMISASWDFMVLDVRFWLE